MIDAEGEPSREIEAKPHNFDHYAAAQSANPVSKISIWCKYIGSIISIWCINTGLITSIWCILSLLITLIWCIMCLSYEDETEVISANAPMEGA